MIQPISQINNKEFFTTKRHVTFKQAESGDVVIAQEQNKTANQAIESLNNSIDRLVYSGRLIAGTVLIGSLFIAAAKAFGGKFVGGLIENNVHSEAFRSLSEDSKIPTLSTCKSLNRNLRTLLENQVAYAKAGAQAQQEAGTPVVTNRLLLSGLPGTGKSFFAKIYAKTLGANYKEIKFSDFNGKHVGIHNENLKAEFESIIRKASNNPNEKYVVVFNEIDSVIVSNERIVNSSGIFKSEERSIFLNYLDECAEKAPNLTIIGTTNNYIDAKSLDGAALSRFKNIFEIPLPEQNELFEALKANLLNIKNGEQFIQSNESELLRIAKEMQDRGFSFRDLENVTNSSKNYYLKDIVEDSNTSFKIEYLQKAKDSLGKTDGEINGKKTC